MIFPKPTFNPIQPKFPGMHAARERILPDRKPDTITAVPAPHKFPQRSIKKTK